MCWTPYTQTSTTDGLFLRGFSFRHLSGLQNFSSSKGVVLCKKFITLFTCRLSFVLYIYFRTIPRGISFI